MRVGAFTDMAGHWALDTVSQAAETGVAAGYPDGSFHPDALIRRGEFFRWLATALDLQPTGSGEHWAVPWLNAPVDAGLATDTGASLDDPVSRLEMASMVGQVVIAHGGPPPGNRPSGRLQSVAFHDARHGLIDVPASSPGVPDGGSRFLTADGGRTWAELQGGCTAAEQPAFTWTGDETGLLLCASALSETSCTSA